MAESVNRRAKAYSNLKYGLDTLDTAYLLFFLFTFAGLGLSKNLETQLLRFGANKFFLFPLYLLTASVVYWVLSLPINFYRSYILERKFSLTNQSIGSWFLDQIKSGVVSYLVGLILLAPFYYIFSHSRGWWWLIISFFWISFSLVLAKLSPLIIIPLFFKYKRFSDETLKLRIVNLAKNMQIKVLDVFEIDFSKKTLKANAALTGLGNSKRVILADTLKDKYSCDEIEAILAHEFAHYKLKHLFKLLSVNSLFIIASFYLIFKTSNYALTAFGLSSLSDIAGLPVILIYFVLFGIIMRPVETYISRSMEKNADMLALKTTGLKNAFISMMEKIAAQNLADRNPHPIIKFFFFDHPPIDERIKLASQIQPNI